MLKQYYHVHILKLIKVYHTVHKDIALVITDQMPLHLNILKKKKHLYI